MSNAGRRIATETGVMLADPELVGNEAPEVAEAIFDTQYWQSRSQLISVRAGRGAAWFVGATGNWVLRHYRRGGFMARISRDLYAWSGEDAVRAFAEWRLLQILVSRGLPVPRPVAARYQRVGLLYRCDLITQRLPNTRPLSESLIAGDVDEAGWRKIGAAIKQLHHNGANHADLNAHNILLGPGGAVSVIDFDRSRLRKPGRWQRSNLKRLHRSLLKVTRDLPSGRFSPVQWSWFMAAYQDGA
jgi:3-deoxy-D-manno-octulosonic acid kinase